MDENDTRQEPSGQQDAQRNLEQRALRNVRGLVDRIQAEDEAKRKSQKWVVGVLVAVVAATAAVFVVGVNRKPAGTEEIVVAPGNKAPAR